MPLLLAEIVSVVVCLSMTSLVYSSVTSLLLLLGVLGTETCPRAPKTAKRDTESSRATNFINITISLLLMTFVPASLGNVECVCVGAVTYAYQRTEERKDKNTQTENWAENIMGNMKNI